MADVARVLIILFCCILSIVAINTYFVPSKIEQASKKIKNMKE